MNLKLQKQKEKEDRKCFLSDAPIIRPIRETKHFDNLIDVQRYLTKYWTNIIHNECNIFGNGNGIRCCGSDIHILTETPLEDALNIISGHVFSKKKLVSFIWINRLEDVKEFQKRQDLIKDFQNLKTEQLLKKRRHSGPAGFYLDGWQREVLKAILDTREHVPTANDRKQLRMDKAKLQKTK